MAIVPSANFHHVCSPSLPELGRGYIASRAEKGSPVQADSLEQSLAAVRLLEDGAGAYGGSSPQISFMVAQRSGNVVIFLLPWCCFPRIPGLVEISSLPSTVQILDHDVVSYVRNPVP